MNEASRAQLNAARPETSTWLSANAGSGKTRVLNRSRCEIAFRGCRSRAYPMFDLH